MTPFLAFLSGHWEWLIVLAIALLLFGHRIPGMARNLGSGIVEFKRGLKDGDNNGSDGADGAVQKGSGSQADSKTDA